MPIPSISVARCAPADLPIIRALAGDIWRRHYPGIITHEQIEYMLARGYSHDALAAFLVDESSGIALARVDEQPVGFAAWYRIDEPATMKLDKLYVRPERHGSGIGRALVEHVERVARRAGCTTLVLNVNKGNATAIDAYERMGFDRREAVVIDIGGGFVMDDYVMVKRLV